MSRQMSYKLLILSDSIEPLIRIDIAEKSIHKNVPKIFGLRHI
jgi:hypothetical protein